ncbi:MAG: hypothetical protein ACLTW6_06175 [Enterobacter sp.]
MAFLIWAAVGWFTFRQSQQRYGGWRHCAPAELAALLIGFAIPANLVVDSKRPQSLVDTCASRFRKADSCWPITLAWPRAWRGSTKRNDITMFDQKRRTALRTGLSRMRKIVMLIKMTFAQWLAEHRQQRGALIAGEFFLSKHDEIARANLPKPDSPAYSGASGPAGVSARSDDPALG